MITCMDCERALHPYLDRELSDEDLIQVQIHLEACKGCDHLYQFQASLRQLVRVRCQEQLAPDGLRARIQASLQAEASRPRLTRRPSA